MLRRIALLFTLAACFASAQFFGGRDPRWQTVGSGPLASRPATCSSGRDVYVCIGTGCDGGNLYYCAATNSWRLQAGVRTVKDYGAIGDGITNDAAAFQAALTSTCADGETLYIPDGTYKLNSSVSCTATAGFRLLGAGPGTVIHLAGSAGISITGSLAVAKDEVFVANLKFTATGNPDFALKLIGVAGYGLSNVVVDGAVDDCLYLLGSQQGYIKGGSLLSCGNGVRLERAAYSGSNAANISGVTIEPTGSCFYIDGADDAFISGNHCTTAAYGVRVISGGTGSLVVTNNHFELHSNNSIKTEAGWTGAALIVTNNSFFNASPAVEMNFLGSGRVQVLSNFINGDVTFGASCLACIFASNYTGGTVTSSATSLQQYGNIAFSGTPLNTATRWYDPLNILPRTDATPGNILTLTAPSVDDHWGMGIIGAGVNRDIYTRYGSTGPTVGSNTGSSTSILFKSAPGGTTWGTVSTDLSRWKGDVESQVGRLNLGSDAATAAGTGRIGINMNSQSGSVYDNTKHAFLLSNNFSGANYLQLRRYDGAGAFQWNDFLIDDAGNWTLPRALTQTGVAFANLGTPANGTWIYCSDCTIANPCAGSGSGAFAKRLNGVWVCN